MSTESIQGGLGVADERPVDLSENAKEASSDFREDFANFVRTPAGKATLILTAAIVYCYWPLLIKLPHLWLGNDGYYSHGFLVPLISGYVVYTNRENLRKIAVKPNGWLLIPLLPVLLLAVTALSFGMQIFGAICLMASIVLTVGIVAGVRWMVATLLPVLYLGFCLPLWTMIIQSYTNPLQLVSTKAAFAMLKAVGLDPLQTDSTTIYLNSFTLDVGVPCSGLKLVLALSAFTAFFMMIAHLRWWANLAMVLLVLPLTIFINGLRIALIGIVGNQWGSDAGHAFHDWSGYLVLILCFYILFKIVRVLGWQR